MEMKGDACLPLLARPRTMKPKLVAVVALAVVACGKHAEQDLPALAASEPERATATSTDASSQSGQGGGLDVPRMVGNDRVDLDGQVHEPPPLEGATRVAAVGWVVPVLDKPDPEARRLGTLRAGTVVEASSAVAGTRGCPGGWRAIQPAGYVCLAEDGVSLDPNDMVVRATRTPDFAATLPYMYGTVTRGGPIYARVPRAGDLEQHESHLDKHLEKWRADKVSGARYGLDVWLRYASKPALSALEALEQHVTDDDIPFFLRDGGVAPNLSGLVKSSAAVKVDEAKRRTGRSFVHSFLYDGRRYNVTPDLLVIPADRFRPIRGSDFHGWRVVEEGEPHGDDAVSFPYALVRREGRKKWRWDGKRMVDDGPLPYRSALLLTGKQKFYRKILHYETKEGFWVDDRSAGRVDPAKRWPKWAKNGAKWIDVNLTKQTLVAYEGMKAVYTTLVSSGEDGLAEGAKATRKGIFRVHTKWVSVTMDSDAVGEEFELRDVPYVQYFEEGYAIHGAYWHDKFGLPKSHGCINLSPDDARRLFFWTDPPLPRGWHSVGEPLTGTIVFVHP